MVKVEGIYRGLNRIGQEILTDERGLELVMGNGNKEKFFKSIDEDIDFALFLHHVNWAKKNGLRGYTFVNIKPSTFLKYHRDIEKLKLGKVVVEMREDAIEDGDLMRIGRIRENFPFLLSLDDMGRGASNLDRVAKLLPNFIKIDMKLFENASQLVLFVNFLRQYAPHSVLIAEKVEGEREFKMAKGAGLEFWSGWYERELKEVRT